MAPRVINPTRHAARRDEFIDAAQRLIITHGYEQMAIEDLLAETGASKGAFYHYFGSKADLLEAVTERMGEQAMAAVKPVLDDHDSPALDRLQRIFSEAGAWKTGHKEFLTALMRSWFSDDNALVREKVRRWTNVLLGPALAGVLRDGIDQGVVTLAEPDELAGVVVGLLFDGGIAIGELYLRHLESGGQLDAARRSAAAYSRALERLLGAPVGSLAVVSDETLRFWFD
jgi:AcrR family transcriptional regulator